jgi:flagellar hook assembly protein FlgD
MSIYPVSTATSGANDTPTTGTGSSGSTGTSATDYQSMFMQLLATELQSQDPTQTMDPTTMVTQMVQINQLSDVAGIYSILQGQPSSTSATGSISAGTPTAAADHAEGPAQTNSNHTTQNILGGN